MVEPVVRSTGRGKKREPGFAREKMQRVRVQAICWADDGGGLGTLRVPQTVYDGVLRGDDSRTQQLISSAVRQISGRLP